MFLFVCFPPHISTCSALISLLPPPAVVRCCGFLLKIKFSASCGNPSLENVEAGTQDSQDNAEQTVAET